MNIIANPKPPISKLPDHNDLPCEDGIPVNNAQEPSQSRLLTDSFQPVLARLHPAEDYFIGEDVGVYWRITDPPLQGAKSPDWYYVPGVPHTLDGEMRRSYVMWQELAPIYLIIEYASGDGSEERDKTRDSGKFWIYEHRIRPAFYAIFDFENGDLEVWHSVEDRFESLKPNKHGRYPLPAMCLELGIWQGVFEGYNGSWLRWWDENGLLLPLSAEIAEQEKQRAEQEKQRAEQEKQRAEQEKQRAEQEKQRADKLAEKLRSMGVDPDDI